MKKIFVFLIILIVSVTVFSQNEQFTQMKKIGVDHNMTDRTAQLLYNMHNPQGVLIGQHNGVWMEERKGVQSNISNLVGKLPSIVSFDFMFITNKNNTRGKWHRTQEHLIREQIIASDREEIYITMCWHYHEPYEGNTFYTKNMKPENVEDAFRSILPSGKNHEKYKKDLRKIAEVSDTYRDDNGDLIPIIFRPFHEFDGEWFWWGAPYNTPEEFKTVWRFTVEYLRDTLGVHNFLYAFSPDIRFESREDFLLRYPGDEYVDIIGFDDYEDFKYDVERTQKAKDRIKIVADISKERNKPAGLTETGYFIKHNDQKEIDLERTKNLLNTISAMHEYLDFVIFWANGGTYDYCIPQKNNLGEKEFREFLEQPFFKLIDVNE